MGRKRFDKLHVELSVLAGVNLPRFDLWLDVSEKAGHSPNILSAEMYAGYCLVSASEFLRKRGHSLPNGGLRRLAKMMAEFNPDQDTPEDIIKRLAGLDQPGR